MAKTQRYYLDFKLQFGDKADLLKVINSAKRLIPRLKGLITNRLANTKLIDQAQIGMLRFTLANRIRDTKRTNSIYDNFGAARSDSSGRSTFFIFHKFMDKEHMFKWPEDSGTPSKKVYLTPASKVIDFFAYGRRGAYHIPKTIPASNDQVRLRWYGRGGKPIFRNIPPSKRVFIRRKVTWGGGLFEHVNWQIGEYVSEVRDEIAAIIRSEGASTK